MSTSVKWRPRLKIHANTRKTCTFDPETCQAYSYDWWRFVDKIKGKVVFNWYRYSVTTSGHQYAISSLLDKLKIKVDIYVNVGGGLQNPEAINSALYHAVYKRELITLRLKEDRIRNLKNAAEDLKDLDKDIANLRFIGGKLTREQVKALKQKVKTDEAERLEYQRQERAKQSAIRKAARKLVKEQKVFNVQSLAFGT
jgi:hypothetical protein